MAGKPTNEELEKRVKELEKKPSKLSRGNEALRESEREVTIRNRIKRIFLTVPDNEMYGEALQVVLEAMDSRYGVFGYLDQDEALICPSMTRDIWEECQLPHKDIVFPRESWGGIWGRALIEKKVLYSSGPFHVPQGHIPIHRALALPIIYQGRVIGLFHVANKATDYKEKDKELLEAIAEHIAPILHARLQRDRQERERKQAEKALKESEEKYRTLFENASGAIYVAQDGRFKFLNPKTEEIYGYSAEELTSKPFTYFMHEKDQEMVLERHKKRLRGETPPNTYPFRIVNKAGDTKWVENHVVMFSWENKPATLSFLTDINERVQAEEALKESEERYRSLFDNVPVAVYRTTPGPKGRYLMANPTFLKMFGLDSEEELKELSVADAYMNPEDRKTFSEDLLAKGSVDRVELPLKKKDGTPFWGSVSARVVYDEGGKTYFFDCTIMDITARKQAEETLRESEERFREMVDLLPTIIGELDLDSQLTYTNKAGLETLGYSQEDLETGLNVVGILHPDDRERALKNMKAVIKGRQLSGNEYRMLRKDGSELAVLLHSGPIYKNGKVVGIRSTLTDITQIKRTEKALREREKELEVKTGNLEEANTALKVLLKRREEDKTEIEEKILLNVRELVAPCIERLKESPLDPRQLSCTDILESNLNDIISPFLRTLSGKYLSLTPKEIQIASVIKGGATNKEIAKLMNLSIRTIEFHRKNIREKLDIKNRKVNLGTHLLSIH